MIESITWYLKNTKETPPKFQEYIYIYIGNYEYISYILSLQFETVTVVLACDDGKIQALDSHCHLPFRVNPPILT